MMTDGSRMLASAVVIPDDPPKATSPTPQDRPAAMKRRQSSESLAENKRPRLSTDNISRETDVPLDSPAHTEQLNGTHHIQSSHQEPQQASTDATSNRRKSSQLNDPSAKERGRNKRLFGGLLSTLSQSGQPAKPQNRHASSNTSQNPAATQQRRAEIEAKQAAKLEAQSSAFEEEDRKRSEQLKMQREIEGEVWEERAMRVRHHSERAMAESFKTKTEPAIYWKPVKWSPGQVDLVRGQIEEAEERMKIERKELMERRKRNREKRKTEETENGETEAESKNIKAEVNGTTVRTNEEMDDQNDKIAPDGNDVQRSNASSQTVAQPSHIATTNFNFADPSISSKVNPQEQQNTNSTSASTKHVHNEESHANTTEPSHSKANKEPEHPNVNSMIETEVPAADEPTAPGTIDDGPHHGPDQEDLHDNDDEQMHGGEGGEDAVIY